MTTARERALAEVRYVRPDMIRVGDLIRLKWSVGDIESSRVGRVSIVERFGSHHEVRTAENRILFEFDGVGNIIITSGDGVTPGVKLTLIDRPATPQPPLFAL